MFLVQTKRQLQLNDCVPANYTNYSLSLVYLNENKQHERSKHLPNVTPEHTVATPPSPRRRSRRAITDRHLPRVFSRPLRYYLALFLFVVWRRRRSKSVDIFTELPSRCLERRSMRAAPAQLTSADARFHRSQRPWKSLGVATPRTVGSV